MLLPKYQTFVIHFCVLLELVPSVLPQYLFRASVGGEGNSRPSYIYGGPLDHFDDGKQSNLYEFTLDNINTVSADNYKPQRLTMDPLTDYFLVEYKSKNSDKVLVARGDICDGGSQDLKIQIANIEIADSNNRYFMDENCGAKCGWGAFTLFNGSIYFVVSGELGEFPRELKREIQLRTLDGCSKTLRMAAIGSGFVDFQILTCSSLVATIYSEDYAWPNPTIGAWSSGSLLATDINNDEHPEFFLQLVHDNNNEVDMRLIQVRTSPNKETTVETLYTAPVDDQYGGNWQFPSLGEVTYLSGTLCWTAAEQLICGLIEHNQATDSDVITDTNVLLESEEAYSANICRGQTSPLPYGHVITGVAIANTAEPLAVYFGCYSDQTTVGGTGMVRVLSIGSKQISGVYSGNTRLLSGSVIVTDYFGDCKQSPAIMKTTQEKDPEVTTDTTVIATIIKTTQEKDPEVATDTTVITTERSNVRDVNQPQPVTLHADNIHLNFALILVCTVITLLKLS